MKRILFFLLCCHFATSAQQNVLVSEISSYHEPSIYINPQAPNEVIAGTALNEFYSSLDGGKTWTSKKLKSSLGVYGDPAMLIDNAGNYYFFHLSNPQAGVEGHWVDRIVCQKSTDKGENWNDGVGIGYFGEKNQDKQWMALNPENNEIYLTWTQFDKYESKKPGDSSIIFFSKSADMGETWSEPLRINEHAGDCLDNDNTVEGATPAVGPNGEIYVSWSGPKGIQFDKSMDAGETWLEKDIFVDAQPQGWTYDIPGIYRCNGLPITACDRSQSAHNGNIYISWSDQRNGTRNTDIWLKRSTDGGESWGELIKVNTDKKKRHQFFSWMCVDQSSGYIYVVYYDRRKRFGKNTDVYLAWSKDGGLSFNDKKISSSPFKPNKKKFFGDYNNIHAVNGQIRPIWTRMHKGKFTIWTAIIDASSLD